MCGIMGYVGPKPSVGIIYDGLKRLEYRGYDSSGIASIDQGLISRVRAKGKLEELKKHAELEHMKGSTAIGHTRWATHGKPSDENAHPHQSKDVVVVHNGIIENHTTLRKKLIEKGYAFTSETDSEIIPYLIQSYLDQGQDFEKAVKSSIHDMRGAFAFVAISRTQPETLIAAKNASPLILGIGQNEQFLASDIPALLEHTRDVVVLEDGELAVLTPASWRVEDFEGHRRDKAVRHITWSRMAAEKEGYKHFMLKEIHEQPRAVSDALRGRLGPDAKHPVRLEGLSGIPTQDIRRIVMMACGTSYHAALVAKFWFESWLRLPVEVELASEFRYRSPVIDASVLCVVISQSGETADTLAALEEARKLGAKVVAVCNCVDSSIARRSHAVLYTQAGPEIGVASTKAFTTQLVVLALLGLHLAQERKSLSLDKISELVSSLTHLPQLLETLLKEESRIEAMSLDIVRAKDCLFLGRGISYPIALEGALKLKEISYIHAEGYPAGELKHGPIALVDESMPIVVLATGGPIQEKMVSNVQEVHARGAQIFAFVSESDHELRALAKQTFVMPKLDEISRPIAEVLPMQLLSYFVADKRGTDVDQPRNLAKSVTVE